MKVRVVGRYSAFERIRSCQDRVDVGWGALTTPAEKALQVRWVDRGGQCGAELRWCFAAFARVVYTEPGREAQD